MPTTDDLRAVLRDRERHAGDADAVRTALQHGVAAPVRSTHNRLAPLIAAAVVVAVAIGIALYATGKPHRAPVQQHSPFGFLHFGVRLDSLKGFDVTYDGISADMDSIKVASSQAKVRAEITVYTHGQFDPKDADDSGKALHGDKVTVNGRPGVYVGPPGHNTFVQVLYWQYAADSWASVGGALGTHPKAEALHIARAVRPGNGPAPKVPFRPQGVPAGFRAVTADGDASGAYVSYTVSGATAEPAFMSRTAEVLNVQRLGPRLAKLEGALRRHSTAHNAVRKLADGGVLIVSVHQNFFGYVSPAVISRVARETDVSPSMTQKSTWLPVAANAPVTTPQPTPTYHHALVWSATMSASSGYTLHRSVASPSGQEYLATGGGRKYYLTVYNPGAFDPQRPGPGQGPLYGQRVIINGYPGVFEAKNSSTLYWQYGPNAWASQFAHGLQLELPVARALHIGTPVRATEPFQVRKADLPNGYLAGYSSVPDMVLDTDPDYTVSYGPGGDFTPFDLGSFQVERTTPGAVPSGKNVRTTTRRLSDGTVLAVSVPKAEWGQISAKQQHKILDDTDVSPEPGDPSTWLPIQ